MANRDVALGLCGVVVGVMLGAGSVLYTQDASLGASTSTEVATYIDLPRGQEGDVREDAGARFLERLDGTRRSRAGTRVNPIQDEEDTTHTAAPMRDMGYIDALNLIDRIEVLSCANVRNYSEICEMIKNAQ